MRDDGRDVQTAFDEDVHLIPSFIHFASVDAFDGEHIEDDGFPVDRKFVGRNAQKRDVSAVRHIGEHIAERLRVARHFHPDIETFLHSELFLIIGDGNFRDVDGVFDAHFVRQFEAFRINVGDDDVPCARVFGDRRRHNADWSRAGNQHVFAENFKRERGVNGVTERIENRGDFEVDLRVVLPNIRHRNSHIFGKTAVRIHADTERIRAFKPATCKTIPTPTTNEMTFDRDFIAHKKITDIRADLNDFADDFMSENRRNLLSWTLRPSVPIPNVNISSANPRFQNADQNIVNPKRRFGNVFEPQTRFRFAFYNCFHNFQVKNSF